MVPKISSKNTTPEITIGYERHRSIGAGANGSGLHHIVKLPAALTVPPEGRSTRRWSGSSMKFWRNCLVWQLRIEFESRHPVQQKAPAVARRGSGDLGVGLGDGERQH